MAHTIHRRGRSGARGRGAEQMRRSPTMARLLDALKAGTDVGHYGQFTFVTVARHYMDDDEIVALLARQPEMDETKARALLMHVEERGYNPPQRERILEQQSHGGFQIIPKPQDPDSGNLYRELEFPEGVYEEIGHYYEQKVESG